MISTDLLQRPPHAPCTSVTPATCSPPCPTGSADCIVTSPPYWAKRDYGVAGQYGHEPDPAAYVATLPGRLPRGPPRAGRRRDLLAQPRRLLLSRRQLTDRAAHLPRPGLAGRHAPGMAAKNLLGLPWRVALALQDDGWIMRNAIVWHKPNAMPESVRDRLNCRYELIFLLVKSRHYWFDLDPIRIPHATGQRRPPGRSAARHPRGRPARIRHAERRPGRQPPGSTVRRSTAPHTRQVIAARRYGTAGGTPPTRTAATPATSGPSRPAPTAARTSPPSPSTIPTRCIQAGCKPGGMVLDPFCGTGTTGLAALSLGRRFTGIDLNPAFAALAAERLRRRHPAHRRPRVTGHPR